MFVQIQIVPALVGAAVHFLYKLLSDSALRSSQQGQHRRHKEAQLEKDTDSLLAFDLDEDISSEPLPEPAPEPSSEVEARPLQTHVFENCVKSRIGLAVFLVVLFLALRVFQDQSDPTTNSTVVLLPAHQVLQHRSGPTANSADLERENEKNTMMAEIVDDHFTNSSYLESRRAELVNSLNSGQGCISGEPALEIRLTRQRMENNQRTNYVKSAYFGTILVGEPKLPMTVVFDTGSGHLILPSMYCKSEACRVHTRYRRSGSSTGRDINFNGSSVTKGAPRDSITVVFGTGEATGVIVEDLICMNPDTNATVKHDMWASSKEAPGCMVMHFLAATDLSADPFQNFEFDGVLGLSLVGLSQTPRHNFLHVLSGILEESGHCASNAFGVFLADNAFEESDISFGGWNQGHLAEQLSWAPVVDPDLGHWILTIRAIRVDGERLDFCDDGRCKAAVDTGTALLSVPPKIFRELFELLRHEAPLAGHCIGMGPLLHFELDDFTVSLGPRDYSSTRSVRKPYYGKHFVQDSGANQTTRRAARPDLRCFPLLMTLDLEEPLGPKLFILGEPVLRKYYTVYDAHRKAVGFGRATHARFPTREELLLKAPELDGLTGHGENKPKRRARSIPNMFDIFRWRKAFGQHGNYGRA